MTEIMQVAVRSLARLKPSEQDEIAIRILSELVKPGEVVRIVRQLTIAA